MREKLAALMHEIWGEWWDYMFQDIYPGQLEENWDSSFVIDDDLVERWNRQRATPYDELSEKEKNSDRQQADKVLALLSYPPEIIHSRDPAVIVADLERWNPPVPVDILQCQGCGKPSPSLSTWTIEDDEGEKVVWLCGSCQGTRMNQLAYIKEDRE